MSASILAVPGGSKRYATVRFEESTKGSFWFITKGLILTLVTVGIYRFWFTTAVRKNLWARIFIDGSPAEYVGKAYELLLGFLVALAVLLPAYIIVFVATMYLPYPALGVVAASVLFFLLLQFARYRARRYIASRTLWRGIRFRQDGSALIYTWLAAGWWLVTIVTLGVAYPFMRASLERHRVRHTLLGEARFTSDASGLSLIVNWLIVYALSILPLLGCAVLLLAANDFEVPEEAFQGDTIVENALAVYLHFLKIMPIAKLKATFYTILISIMFGMLAKPYYQAREARSFYNSIKLGDARIYSDLSAADMYINKFFFYFINIATVSVLSAPLFAVPFLITKINLYNTIEKIYYGYIVFAYAVCVLMVSWSYFRFLQVGRFAIVSETLSITGAEALTLVRASTRKVGSSFDEGMADAVDPGGIDVGF